MVNYFRSNKSIFDMWGRLVGALPSGECLQGAFWAVKAHFTTTDEPALVSLPVGTGKNALMTALSFEYEAERVLVITPLRLLRDQITREFETLRTLKDMKVIPPTVSDPDVCKVKKKLGTIAEWNDLRKHDVVVATPKTASPKEKDVCTKPPSHLFDFIFLDEAHHAPAPTWKAIIDYFKGIKCILLTSTPYRRDKRTINAPLIYHYPISRAITMGMHRSVAYHPVTCNKGNCTSELCQEAVNIRNNQQKNGFSPKLLIQTNRIKDIPDLIKLYSGHGLKIAEVTSAKSWRTNVATIQELQKGNLDGLVCAGMMGDGLVLPELKIAVLHSAPRSLPFTLQVVGRIPQPAKKWGDGHLVAVPQEVRSVMQKLHTSDIGWDWLIPELAAIVVGLRKKLGHLQSDYAKGEVDVREWYINPHHLKPFFSVRIYEIPKAINLKAEVDIRTWPKNVNIYFRKLLFSHLVAVVTGIQEEPSWAKGTGIENQRFDLHIFYHNEEHQLLFEATTSRKIARKIRSALTDKCSFFVNSSDVRNLLHRGGNYSTIGLKNIRGYGIRQPSYVTLMGANVQNAVYPSYREDYGLGHALKEFFEGGTRGVSTLKGGAWAIKRDTIKELQQWCKEMATEIRRPPIPVDVLDLAFSHDIVALEKRPLAVLLDDSISTAICSIITNERIPIEGNIFPYIKIKRFLEKEGRLECELCFHSEKPGITLFYSPSRQQVWQKVDSRDLHIRLEFSPEEEFEGDLQDYLQEFPPLLVMPEGGVIINRQRWEPQQTPGLLPPECFKSKDWGSCNKKNEEEIHDWMEEELKRSSYDDAIIIKNHARGEIADFIVLDSKKDKEISFYHCKAMSSVSPKANVTDAQEVFEQAIRSGRWILLPELAEELYNHIQRRSQTDIVAEENEKELKMTKLNEVADSFKCNEWKYRVVVVQPGLKCEKIKTDTTTDIHSLVVVTYEWLTSHHAEFAVWGS
ncbi:MAG: DEAD/DEAH box helicase family protein [Theionarchaea archaeon]|nr:DEAD/DEAH box helicase family protein [Theionarchaea archaeon]